MTARESLNFAINWGSNEARLEAASIVLEQEDNRMDRRLRAIIHAMWMGLVITLACFAMCCTRNVRTIAQEHESAVTISAQCEGMEGEAPIGTGVIVSPNSILTAAHVASPTMDIQIGNQTLEIPLACTLTALTEDGTRHPLELAHTWKDHDVARLVSKVPFSYEPVKLASTPAPGETVCVVSRVPNWYRRCGSVEYYRDDLPGDVQMDVVVEPGNSGSAVYDNRGRLVGIATHLLFCRNKQWCGGKFASLEFLKGEVL